MQNSFLQMLFEFLIFTEGRKIVFVDNFDRLIL